MEHTRQKSNTKAFTLIEMVVVMFIIAAILSAVIPAIVGATNNSTVANAVASIRALQTAATGYYTANGGTYTGGTYGTISVANLSAQGMLPAKASGSNPWGGTYTVVPDTNANYVDITLTNVPSNIQALITKEVANAASVAPTYSATSQQWMAGF
ncbi:MAG: type II secretion system protein [Candidatus Omnitrophica bacterium]|nr:type II secretion system protein [Candidatus Omnitrophota bacterium]MDE2213672.1 type II secretion system protein [Candidatus Omnitrophota bacterium]MDE2230753.1 type II secretion system protein [Candidatus Omnitrophota bacterium]